MESFLFYSLFKADPRRTTKVISAETSGAYANQKGLYFFNVPVGTLATSGLGASKIV